MQGVECVITSGNIKKLNVKNLNDKRYQEKGIGLLQSKAQSVVIHQEHQTNEVGNLRFMFNG